MRKVTIVLQDNMPPFMQIEEGEVSRKGYFHPKDGSKIINMIGSSIFHMKNENEKINWIISQKNVVAKDQEKDAIIVKIPANTYYIPVVGKEKNVFKVELPNLIGVKIDKKVFIYWTDDSIENITIDSHIYNLALPHLYGDGSICIGNFKAEIDYNNPTKFFEDLISYPVSHQHEVNILRNLENEGFKGIKSNKKTIKDLL